MTVERKRGAELPMVVEAITPHEQRMSFRVGDSWCRSNALQLRSGIRFVSTTCQFDPSFSFSAIQPAADIELSLLQADRRGTRAHILSKILKRSGIKARIFASSGVPLTRA